MRVIYVAKHGSGGNDDEAAIAHALEALGHEVVRINESVPSVQKAVEFVGPADLMLFHGWAHSFRPKEVSASVFWYFDLVQWYDKTLEGRCRQRVSWMNGAIRNVDLGFCTDGDWVAQDTTGKLVWLTQGADERVLGRGAPPSGSARREIDSGAGPQILFTGIGHQGGVSRGRFVEMMEKTYGKRFSWVKRGVYRRQLADMIARHPVLVCPDSPVTERYWSNRIYNAAGFGACVLHPWCGETLALQYRDDFEVRYYFNESHLHALVEHYLRDGKTARELGEKALGRTAERHTYRHRVIDMLAVVKERLGVF